MKFRPLHDRVLIKVLDSDEKTAGGIIIPDTAKEKPQEGEVVAVGPGAKNEEGKLTLEIEDNGIGIKKEHEDQIWDIFFRGTSTIPGSGLGLYILRESAKNIGGEVSYVSEEGAGTKFTVTLPALEPTE